MNSERLQMAKRAAARLSTELQRNAPALSKALEGTLPDPNITGPCQVQSSPFCEPSEGRQRMNPTDMLEAETSFRGYVQICQPCYDTQADLFVATTHGRA